MTRVFGVIAVVCMACASIMAQSSIVSFSDTYKGTLLDGPSCSVNQPILGYQPSTPGSYPLFVYEVGTISAYNGGDADASLRAAAARGFVAISAKYNNGFNRDCTTLNNKAMCLYNSSAQSALSKGCARADCSKGIIMGGFSQGSQLALIAKNYDSRVKAVWTQGVGMSSNVPLDSCLSANTRVLPADRVRMINGEHDIYVPDSSAAEAITGMICAPGVKECMRADGSGWYRVQNSDIGGDYADHTFFAKGFLTGQFEPGYLPPYQSPWSIERNLDWLQSYLGQ
jgi:hypothetical protein